MFLAKDNMAQCDFQRDAGLSTDHRRSGHCLNLTKGGGVEAMRCSDSRCVLKVEPAVYSDGLND